MTADASPLERLVLDALAGATAYLRTRDVARAADLPPTRALAVLKRLRERRLVVGRRTIPGQLAMAWRVAA